MSGEEFNTRMLRVATEICVCDLTDGFCSPQSKPDCKCWHYARLAVAGINGLSIIALHEAWPDLPPAEARDRLHKLVEAIQKPQSDRAKL